MTAPSPNSWDEDALDDCEGCSSPEIADTGNAMVGCLGWAMIVFTAGILWLVIECVRG